MQETTRSSPPLPPDFAAGGGAQAWIAALVLVAAIAAMAIAGICPEANIGNDADAYIMAAETFADTGQLTLGERYRTKFPPATALLAAACLIAGLPLSPTMQILNALCLTLVCLLVLGLFAGRGRPWIGLIAGLFIGLNPLAWAWVNMIGSDILFLLPVGALLFICLRPSPWTSGRIMLAAALLCAAVTTRTIGLAVAGAPLAALAIDQWGRHRGRVAWGCALLVAAPLALNAAHSVYQNRLPGFDGEYVGSFLQVDPYDASRGTLSPASFAARCAEQLPPKLRDTGAALTANSLGRFVQPAVTLILLLAGAGLGRRQAPVILIFIAGYGAALILWPYFDKRFSLPLLIAGGIGVGVLAEAAAHSRPLLRAALGLILLAHLANGATQAPAERVRLTAQRAALAAEMGELIDWIETNVGGREPIATFDAVELLRRVDRPLVPLRYTADMNELAAVARAGNARWLLVTGQFGRERGVYSERLRDAIAEPAPAFSNATFALHRVR
jgi:hypothetical protein